MSQAALKCLLVDGDDKSFRALSALLAHEGLEVLTAPSAAAALQMLQEPAWALAVLGADIPDADGFELAERIRSSEHGRDVPLILLARDADLGRRFPGDDHAAVDVLHRESEPHVLRRKAALLLELHRHKQLLQLNDMFTAVLGHDLRDPLHAIVLSTSLLQSQSPDPKLRKTTDMVLASGMRMTRMIEDLLETVRAHLEGGIPARRERIDLGQLLQRVLDEFRVGNPGRQVELQVRGDVLGDWDTERMGQAITRLAGHSFGPGESELPLQVVLDGSDPGHVTLLFSGPCTLPPELLPHLFDPFRPGLGRSGRSRWLGLYIARQIVLAHGGRIQASAGQDGGSRYELRLPRYALASP
jgi:two-component system sensor histidine kinase/response regulator